MNKILVFTKNWLGDILFELPALAAIRENFPGAHITALAPSRCQDILKAAPSLDEVRVFDERSSERSLFSKLRFIRWLRRERFDKVFLFHRSFTRAFLARLGGIPERIGFETGKRKWVLTRAVPRPRTALHQVDYFLLLLKWAGLRVKFGAEYRFFYRPEDEAKAGEIMNQYRLEPGKFAAFHVGANWGPKRWPDSHFARLAELMADTAEEPCPVVLTGADQDKETAEKIRTSVKSGRVVSVSGETSLGELGALFRRAAFVVSSDSGPLHIASGVGTPVAALFGPTCPRLTGPRGTGRKIVIQFVPPGYLVPWKGDALPPGGWMERISPEEVLEALQRENLWPLKKEKISSLSR